jgi:hypothetical protein
VTDIGVVIIGRNEGERLRRCLESVLRAGAPASHVAYVDSGSTDDSVAFARGLGVEVVELDMAVPFTAARARNAGHERLTARHSNLRYFQFIDGDCELRDGWLERAAREMSDRPDAAVVFGRVRERSPEASVYNRLADLEWDVPVGEVSACGGIAMMRDDAFDTAGGFDPTVVAGEEPELCQRLRALGGKVYRIDAEMVWHDSAMTHFGQWWRRQVRGGYGWMDVVRRFGPGPDGGFERQLRGPRYWAVGWPAALVAVALPAVAWLSVGVSTDWTPATWAGLLGLAAAALIAALLPLNVARLAVKARRRLPDWRSAFAFGVLTMLAKWANVAGQVRWVRDRRAGHTTRLIEYKGPAANRPAAQPAR